MIGTKTKIAAATINLILSSFEVGLAGMELSRLKAVLFAWRFFFQASQKYSGLSPFALVPFSGLNFSGFGAFSPLAFLSIFCPYFTGRLYIAK